MTSGGTSLGAAADFDRLLAGCLGEVVCGMASFCVFAGREDLGVISL